MSFSALTTFEENRCCVCGRKVTDETAGVVFLGTGGLFDEEAQEYAEDEFYDGEPVNAVVGYEWREQYLGHSKCLAELITDAAAEVKLGVR